MIMNSLQALTTFLANKLFHVLILIRPGLAYHFYDKLRLTTIFCLNLFVKVTQFTQNYAYTVISSKIL